MAKLLNGPAKSVTTIDLDKAPEIVKKCAASIKNLIASYDRSDTELDMRDIHNKCLPEAVHIMLDMMLELDIKTVRDAYHILLMSEEDHLRRALYQRVLVGTLISIVFDENKNFAMLPTYDKALRESERCRIGGLVHTVTLSVIDFDDEVYMTKRETYNGHQVKLVTFSYYAHIQTHDITDDEWFQG